MSHRSRLPTSFLVGIFSAIALGLAWGLVYISLPAPTPPDANNQAPLPTRRRLSIPSDRQTSDAGAPPGASSSPAQQADDAEPTSSTEKQALHKPLAGPDTARPLSRPPPRTRKRLPSGSAASTAQRHTPSPSTALPLADASALHGVSPACLVELEKLCDGMGTGGARRKCFRDNEKKLSPACQRQMDEMAARIKEDMRHFRVACAGDVSEFCPDVAPGGGNVMQCLEDNYKEVSEQCYDALKRFQKMKAGRSL